RGFAVEDTAAVLLRFEGGALGTVMLSDTAASPFCWDQTAGETKHFPRHAADAYRISGTEGTLELPSLTLWRYPGARGWTERFEVQHLEAETADPLQRQTRHFLRVIRGEEPPLVSGLDGARTVAATLAVSRSALEGRPIRIDEMMGPGTVAA
ncbi:Gfo/Idh/MocA family oxidoreductase, partial [Acidisphaera sp. L21]|uniref:Gfo/Idh/MocA family oxidoreductase n=1 Tax=Acidisphaera sp. L21 TaxID=1641851 RepID=UPI0020B15BA7